MDCRMPHLDGYEATREIRRRERGGRRTPIVAMTAAALPADRERCLEAGMDDHTTKPLRGAALDAVLTRYLAPSAGAPPSPQGSGVIEELRAVMGPQFEALVRRYIDDAAASLAALEREAAAGNDAEVERIAHRLKGSAGLVSETGLAEMCQQLVDDPRAPVLPHLRAEIAAARTRLQAAAGLGG